MGRNEDPLTAMRFRMEQQNLTQKDLTPFIGSPSKVSEVLAGTRQLTKTTIRTLTSGLGIPAEVLLQESKPHRQALDSSPPTSEYSVPA